MAADAREFLKVPENATMQQLADAFRRVALSAHPDAGGSALRFRRCVSALRLVAGAAMEAPPAAPRAAPVLPAALQRLERALRSLERPERREALEQMPQKVRFALHHHMLSSEAATARTEESKWPCTLPPSRGTGSCLERRVGGASRCEYRVRQSLGRIEVRTEYVSCLGRALHFLALLVQLQALLSSATMEGYVRAFHLTWCRLCDSVDESCVDDLPPQLAFRATLCCCAVKLEGPYTDQLQVALEQHLQLQEAYCRGGWLKLHMAFQKLTGAELTKVSDAQLRGQLWRAVRCVERALRRGAQQRSWRRKVRRLHAWRK